ncbi:MAG: hypothetical protein LBM65_01410 [Oscillospiraceae bacterium]|nr:hypothetical protein [Oscillospiraceae bacterium]
MLKFSKKNKKEQAEEFTPIELLRLSGKRGTAEYTKARKNKRRAFWLLISLVSILLVMWIISLLLTQWGDLVISIERDAASVGISVSDNVELKNKTTILSGDNILEVTNITYENLPFLQIENTDGSHNGPNYLAYTFYVTNSGQQTANVVGQLQITGVAKNMDTAVRIIVYKDGEPVIYAKPAADGSVEAFPEGVTSFLSDTDVMETVIENLAPGQSTKFTIVSYVEGEDPECIDDIRGGYMRMSMLFGIADEEG